MITLKIISIKKQASRQTYNADNISYNTPCRVQQIALYWNSCINIAVFCGNVAESVTLEILNTSALFFVK